MIETDRLTLRRFRDTDYQDLYEYLSDPAIYAFEPGGPIDLDEAKRQAAEKAALPALYAVEVKETGKLIGHLYFAQTDAPKKKTWELGVILGSKYHRKGYASEAGRALVEHAFAHMGVHRVMARCVTANPASPRLLERIGFRREGHFRKCGTMRSGSDGTPIWHDVYEYGMLAEDL